MNRRFAIAAFCVALLSCSDSGPSAAGTVSFTYVIDGATVTFTATGNVPTNGTNSTAWAVGLTQVAPSEGSMALAFRPRGDTASDIIIVASALTTVGSSPITSVDCDSISCTGFVALFAGGNMCALGSGTVILTEATSKRLSGSFTGDGMCFDLADTSAFSDSVSFVVSNGSFNVPIMESLPGGELRAGGSGVGGLDATIRMRRRALLPLKP